MIRTRKIDSLVGLIVILIGLAFGLSATAALAQVPVVHVDFPKAASEIPITQWQVLGPFLFDKKDMEVPDVERRPVGLNQDYLKAFGLDESTADAESFLSAKTPTCGIVLDQRFGNKPVATQAKTNILQLASKEQPCDYAVVYAAAIIESPRDQEILIAAGSDDGMQIRLNHELLFADANTADRNLTKFNRLIGASLKKGTCDYQSGRNDGAGS